MNNIQYTVRNIPESLDKKLRLRAKKSKKSFNSTLIQALQSSTDQGLGKSDLDWLYGSGGLGREELQAFTDQRTVDRQAWKN